MRNGRMAAAGDRLACWKTGMDLLNALLDVADAISAGVAVVAFWYTWVAPPRRGLAPPPRPSDQGELEQFLHHAALVRPSDHPSPEADQAEPAFALRNPR
jgi:hypothetical protein